MLEFYSLLVVTVLILTYSLGSALLELLKLGFVLSHVENAHELALIYGNPLHLLATSNVNYLT